RSSCSGGARRRPTPIRPRPPQGPSRNEPSRGPAVSATGLGNGSRGGGSVSCLLTFDVEEWFHAENLRPVFPRAHWERFPRRVVDSTRVVIALLAEYRLRATFFILGWVAEREPALVREIAAHGHEIAAHGHGHVLPMQL